jgi:hypothetical protein
MSGWCKKETSTEKHLIERRSALAVSAQRRPSSSKGMFPLEQLVASGTY